MTVGAGGGESFPQAASEKPNATSSSRRFMRVSLKDCGAIWAYFVINTFSLEVIVPTCVTVPAFVTL